MDGSGCNTESLDVLAGRNRIDEAWPGEGVAPGQDDTAVWQGCVTRREARPRGELKAGHREFGLHTCVRIDIA